MPLGRLQAITDVCLLVEDIERTVAFYTEKLGFKLRRRAEGFADFHGRSITLAAWEIDHIHDHVGVSNARAPANVHKACVAVELESPDLIDELHAELTARGVAFQAPPGTYDWNAYCAYFTDPDGTLWELYSWVGDGPDGYHEVHADT